MKTEGDLNQILGKKLKVLWPELYHIKASDKFTLGISDFLLWYNSESAGLETKLVLSTPSMRSKLLTHPFSGAQITFLESLSLTKNRGWGGVYVKETDSFYLIPYPEIPKTGNWKTEDFFAAKYKSVPLNDVKALIGVIFGSK